MTTIKINLNFVFIFKKPKRINPLTLILSPKGRGDVWNPVHPVILSAVGFLCGTKSPQPPLKRGAYQFTLCPASGG
jgi:uncharacterized membrane protein